MPNHETEHLHFRLYLESAKSRDLAPIFEDLSQNEKLSEIKSFKKTFTVPEESEVVLNLTL